MADSDLQRTVLVVEDDRDVRESILEVLEDNAYVARGARNGFDALEQLTRDGLRPCLILLDVMMPVMDGWQFRAAQRENPALAAIPVVVLTAHTNARQAAEQMQAAGFLKKPVRLEALLSTVERFCQR